MKLKQPATRRTFYAVCETDNDTYTLSSVLYKTRKEAALAKALLQNTGISGFNSLEVVRVEITPV